jgi:hypothetical protein
MTTAILTIIASILGLAVWWIKRKKAPTLPEKLEDSNNENEDSWEKIRELRSQGKQDQAEAMLARIRMRALHGWMFNYARSSISSDSAGKRLGDDPAKGNQDQR